MLTYPAILDTSRELTGFVAALLAAERRARGTLPGTRAPGCWKQALFAVSWFRDRPNIARHGAAFAISQATAYRYLHEAIDVLADAAPTLHDALERAADGMPHVILDGKIFTASACHITTTSVKGETIDAWYSGKIHGFGGNIQAVFAPNGVPICTSEVEPGSVHDLTAAHRHALGAPYKAAADGLPTLADPGYDGAGIGIRTPAKNPADGNTLDVGTRTRNALLRSLRCHGERGFSILTSRWTALQHTTLAPSRIGDIVKAALTLTHFEHKMIK